MDFIGYHSVLKLLVARCKDNSNKQPIPDCNSMVEYSMDQAATLDEDCFVTRGILDDT